MKKNILFLINGFGIEQIDSYNVYDKNVMPNLDRLTNDWLFSSLKSKELDYKDGYRKFSIGISEALTYSIVEQDIIDENYINNSVYKDLIANLTSSNSKLHVFCYYENDKTIKQLTYFLKKIDMLKIKIYVHLILCQKSLNSYKDMSSSLLRINYEFENIKIGLVSGLNNLTDINIKEVIKPLILNIGEKWNDLSKKVKVLQDTKTLPVNARTFIVSDDIKIENNDTILFYNYFLNNVNPIINELNNPIYNRSIDSKTIKYYSLFPLTSNKQIPYIYNYAVSTIYFLSSLKSISAKCLIFDKKENSGYINYYMTGLKSITDSDLQYYFIDNDVLYDKNKIINLINSFNHDLIILNYEIDSCKTIEEIKSRLSQIDMVIEEVEKNVLEKDGALIISSLYGIEKELMNQKLEIQKINFSSKVPLIIVDKSYSKINYSLSEGNLYDLSNTILKNINSSYNSKSLIKKKSTLLSIFYKKKKEK